MKVPLSYEKLFDFLREERNNVQLQKLPSSYYKEIVEYLSLKEKSLESLKKSGSLTFDNSAIQLRNAKRIIENIYERREKKILSLALNKSRTKSQLIDISGLLPEEKLFFKQLTIVLDHFRDEVLTKLLDKSLPVINEMKDSVEPEISEPESETPLAEVDESQEPESEIPVKFLQYVDKFVGPDLEILGPFEEGDVQKLPVSVADVVISKGYAEKV